MTHRIQADGPDDREVDLVPELAYLPRLLGPRPAIAPGSRAVLEAFCHETEIVLPDPPPARAPRAYRAAAACALILGIAPLPPAVAAPAGFVVRSAPAADPPDAAAPAPRATLVLRVIDGR